MKNVIIALIIIASVIGIYRFVSSRREEGERQPVETTEAEAIITPTIKNEQEIISSQKTDDDLPAAGASTEDKELEVPSQEEIEKIIQEFRQ